MIAGADDGDAAPHLVGHGEREAVGLASASEHALRTKRRHQDVLPSRGPSSKKIER